MDELDRKIIALLQLDGRASNAKIAREVSVSAVSYTHLTLPTKA